MKKFLQIPISLYLKIMASIKLNVFAVEVALNFVLVV